MTTRVLLLVSCVILTPIGNLLLKWGMNECGSITWVSCSIT